MDVHYDNLYQLLKDCKSKKDYDQFIIYLKKIVDTKNTITIKITDGFGQLFCCILTEIVNDKEFNDLSSIEVVCDTLLSQVSISNVRWYLLEKCQLLQCLTRKYLNNPNILVQVKICKTIQTFLIYSRIDESTCLISSDLVCELLKTLVILIKSNQYDQYNEAFLGLLASLCQIWSNCTKLTSVLDDYQVLRKVLLRFLSAEMVKRTTIVYTMTIMFHLCNSDDRLFNKRNIKQTLQVLFNIMLNGENGWASLYAATLLTEICKSNRTSHLLSEFKSLPSSLKETILQINRKESIIIEKFLEFLLTFCTLNSDYRRLLMDNLLSNDTSNYYKTSIDTNETYDNSGSIDFITLIIQLINNSEINICICATRIVDHIYMELYSHKTDHKLPNLNLLCDTIHQFLQSLTTNSIPITTRSSPTQPDNRTVEQHLNNQMILSNLTRIKVVMQLATNLLVTGEEWIKQAELLITETDRIIRDQLESNLLCIGSDKMDALWSNSSRSNETVLKVISISVEVFIDMLYFYYRATELRPSMTLFGEKLKDHLEHINCPIMLAYGLSAATNNQVTLQRALILQGVCLHLQEFNVELMGEKMYQFSNEFSKLKSTLKVEKSSINKSTSPYIYTYKETNKDIQNIKPTTTSIPTTIATSAATTTTAPTTSTNVTCSRKNSLSSKPTSIDQSAIDFYSKQSISHSNKKSINTELGDGDKYSRDNQLNTDNKTTTATSSTTTTTIKKSSNNIESIENNYQMTFVDLYGNSQEPDIQDIQRAQVIETISSDDIKPSKQNLNIDTDSEVIAEQKIEEIVNHWIENPDKTFGTTEICAIYERRIQNLQNQESLMEEIISNKTAALHQSEALLSQYRNKLTNSEKESKQLRQLQMEAETKIVSLNKINEEQKERIVELETFNETLMEHNQRNESEREQSEFNLKQLEEQVIRLHEENKKLQSSIQEITKKFEEANKIITYKDSQLANYSHVTKLINKLTGNKQTLESSFYTQPNHEETSSCTSTNITPLNNRDITQLTNFTAAAQQQQIYNSSNNQSNSTQTQLTNTRTTTTSPVIDTNLTTATTITTTTNQINTRIQSMTTNQNNIDDINQPINQNEAIINQPTKLTSISAQDFLQLYKSNSHFLQNKNN